MAVAAVVVGVGGIGYGAHWWGGGEFTASADAAPDADPGTGSGPDVGPSPGSGDLSPDGVRRDAQGRRVFSVLGAGDVLVHPEVWEQARADARRAGGSARFDFYPMFERVTPAITQADLAICHLEVPLAGPAGPYQGFPRFSAPPQLLDGLRQAGFDACSTASNHTIDQGEKGVVRTLDALDEAGIGHTGSARSAAEAATPTIYDRAGVRVGHLSYTLHLNGLNRPAGKDWLANVIDPDEILAAARELRAAGADIVVCSLHWGTEYQHEPDARQERWAERLISSPDIDVILGHHAHVVQPFAKFADEWVVYGMGNQLARHSKPIDDNREGVMARITLTETAPKDWRVTSAEAIPTWTDLSPDLRLVDLSSALADPALPAARRKVYQAAYDRVAGHVNALGADRDGLTVAPVR